MENSKNGDSSEDEDNLPLSHLLNHLPVAKTITEKDASDWLNEDEQCKLFDEAIANLMSRNNQSDDEDGDLPSHEGLEKKSVTD